MSKELEAAKKKAKIEEQKKIKQKEDQLNTKYASVTPDDMLKKILVRVSTHLSKCLNMINKLFKESILSFDKSLLHISLLILCNNFQKIDETHDYEIFREIFCKVFEHKDEIFGADFALLESFFDISGRIPIELLLNEDSFKWNKY